MLKQSPRLYQTGWYFSFPLTETLSFIVGCLLMATASNEFQDQYFIGTFLIIAAVGSGILGWPLLLLKINFFWLDIAYIAIPTISYFLMLSYNTEMSIPSLAIVFLGPGIVLAGLSHLIRRGIAFLIARKKTNGDNTTCENEIS